MKTIRIAGVPEHFNYPWQYAIQNKLFEAAGIDLQWTNIPEGTGKMCQMLREEKTDMSVILTEGIVKDILSGNNSKIVQVYVDSPLIWGIHVAAESNYHDLSDLENKKVAISRIGSGSQLMAYVNAKNQNWDTRKLEFEIVNTIEGAVIALSEKKADYFMWERFMTKPLVDRGIFRHVADCPTPWPGFVIAVRDAVMEEDFRAVKSVLSVINDVTVKFKSIPNIAETLASVFNQETDDIKNWLSRTQWSQKAPEADMLNNVQNQLLELGLIDKKGTFAQIAQAL